MERWHHDELIHYKKHRNVLILARTLAICISLHFKVPMKKKKLKTVFGFELHWPVVTKPLDQIPQLNRR